MTLTSVFLRNANNVEDGNMIKRNGNRRKKKHRWLWWLSPIVLVGVYGMMVLVADNPPVEKLERTRLVLSEAGKMDAGIYSHTLFKEAGTLYDSAMITWKRENDKWIILRKFDQVVSLAGQSEAAAQKAMEHVLVVKRNMKESLGNEITRLRREMEVFEKFFATLPLDKEIKSQHSQGKLLLNEAEIAFEKGLYNAGTEKSHEAAQLIGVSYGNARKLLEKYFTQLPHWQKQLETAITLSKRHYVIVVEKIPARCDLYYKGIKKYSFPAEFGRNWIGDKRCEGDYATPEGEYRVEKKLSGRQTIYYKALLVDYPNAADRANLDRLKKNGEISSHARPGSLIEIHGDGGRGVNWTNGCVALANKDMDVLFRYASKGTPILIIGASEPWDKQDK